MNKRQKEIDDAVDAMVMLSKQRTEIEFSETIYAILRGDGWKEIINVTSFNINILDKSIHFLYNEQEKVWSIFVVKGFVKVNNENVIEGCNINLVDGAIVDVEKYSFIFVYGQRPKKYQKSYQKIISDAIRSSKEGKMTLAQIYNYFIEVAGFSISDCTTWKNSIRHNLSLNKIFKKVPRTDAEPSGKGAYWAIDDKYIENDRVRKENIYIKEKTIESEQANIKTQDYLLGNKKNQLESKSTKFKKPDEFSETDDINPKYIIFKKPSENVRLLQKSHRRKRKTKDSREDVKRYKSDFFSDNESSDCERDNLYGKDIRNESQKFSKTLDQDVFSTNRFENIKLKRSQSIIELPDDLASLTLDTSRRSRRGGAK